MKSFLLILLLTFTGPLWLYFGNKIDMHDNWRTASRVSANLAPDPKQTSEAIIQLYSARAFNWRGLFAVHTWLAVKPKNAEQYTVYQFIGWRLLNSLSPMTVATDIPDRFWFNQQPKIFYELRGINAEKIIPMIAQAAKTYPFPNQYNAWPGPNSNTFIAYIARQVPEMHLVLPSNALGKDYLAKNTFFASAVSGTGYQVSLWGILGITLAVREGLEINILGLVYGISPMTFTIKLPGFGDIKLS